LNISIQKKLIFRTLKKGGKKWLSDFWLLVYLDKPKVHVLKSIDQKKF
jgi:hypothetical protein